MISTLGKNRERKKAIDFTVAYSPVFIAVFGPKTKAEESPADIAGKFISVACGLVKDAELTKVAPPTKELRLKINEILRDAKGSGDLDEMTIKWMGRPAGQLPHCGRRRTPRRSQGAIARHLAGGSSGCRCHSGCILARLGPISGWSVGSKAPQAEPACAPLPATRLPASGITLVGDAWRMRGVEVEVTASRQALKSWKPVWRTGRAAMHCTDWPTCKAIVRRCWQKCMA